jgi:hypothetical protein
VSDTKHTPGPWSFDENETGRTFDACFGVAPSRGLSVAFVPCRADDGTAEANARLIAAAPELLAAAKVGHWVADGPGCKPGCPLCAAIQKAEGRS